jgi:hypothetical protein
MSFADELKETMKLARVRLNHLTAVNLELAKERDELVEENAKLQVEAMQWQDDWYKMKMALRSACHRLMYPKRSQRIYENLTINKEKLGIKKKLIKKPK